MTDITEPVNFPGWIEGNKHLLKPPVGNKEMFPGGSDFIVQVVGGPNQRTDFHVDPYEEFFYQVKGNMHVNLMTPDGPATVHIREGEMWMLPGNVPHSPQRPEAGSIGMVVERVREEGTLEKFQWYCPDCGHLAARGRAPGPRHRQGPAAGLPGLLRRRGRPHLRRVRRAPPGQGLMAGPVVDVHTHLVPKGWPDLAAALRRLGLAPAPRRLRARRHDHGGRDRVPPDRRRGLGPRHPAWPTWTPTASTCRSSPRRRSSSRTSARPPRR